MTKRKLTKRKKINRKRLKEKRLMDEKKTDKKKKTDIQIKERQLRDIIFIYNHKNKMGDIFLSGQNQCHSTGVKKSNFGHTLHLRPKKVCQWRVTGEK